MEWCTRKQNVNHALCLGARKPSKMFGENNPATKLSDKAVSEIKSLLTILENKPQVNIDTICDIYAYRTIFNTKTPFEGITLMPHAVSCTISKDKFKIKQYWDYPMHIDQIGRLGDMDPGGILSTLMKMELKGIVKQLPGKMFVR